ncbi:dihydroorotate dehydrogenase electron transfer subunit [Selenomonas ruminantium]|uniref:Dihydroorotate dehydrogenase B (NAD(+)), electron transfer subunit n=1 Tax=Selenomonas ruminantium TaxID=971 RepID=A0A1H0M5D9_SELRU|nr:dihydroorotate dehydrogenase electron transfer subunit [Selenomonas ruminantium]
MPKFAIDGEIVAQKELAQNVWRLEVEAPKIAREAEPGQFVQLQIPSGAFTLRRPVGIAEVNLQKGTVAFIYRVVGKGTKALSALSTGTMINVLGPLGHGFSCKASRPLLVGGGMGLSPLLFYAQHLQGQADVLMGGRCERELFWQEIYAPHVQEVFCTTDDGSCGTKGFTTTLLPELLAKGNYDLVIACGPEIMMKGIAKIAQEYNVPCQVSLEKRMGCGLGACLSCSIDTTDGQRKKVCKDGPVFWAEEVFDLR